MVSLAGLFIFDFNKHLAALSWIPFLCHILWKGDKLLRMLVGLQPSDTCNFNWSWRLLSILEFGSPFWHCNVSACRLNNECCTSWLYSSMRWWAWWQLMTFQTTGDLLGRPYPANGDSKELTTWRVLQTQYQTSNNILLNPVPWERCSVTRYGGNTG